MTFALRIRVALLLLTILIFTATIFYHLTEGWHWIDALYFSVATMTTVGYGDITPTSLGTKVFTVFFMTAAVALALYSIGLATHRRLLIHFGLPHKNNQNKNIKNNRRKN